MTIKTILGIDPALSVTGWGVLVVDNVLDSKLLHVANGIIKTNPKQDLAHRLQHIFLAITDIIKTYSPNEIALEKTFVNINGASSLVLATARGAHLIAAAIAGIPIFEYAPTQVKKAVTGYGQSEKKQVRVMVELIIPNCPKQLSDDESDALGVAIAHYNFKQQDLP